MATKKMVAKVPVPTVLDHILAQQKKAARGQRVTAPVRTARLYLNGKVLAIGLYEDGEEWSYTPAYLKTDPFKFMSDWVQFGKPKWSVQKPKAKGGK